MLNVCFLNISESPALHLAIVIVSIIIHSNIYY